MAFITKKARSGIDLMVCFAESYPKVMHLYEFTNDMGMNVKQLEQIAMPLSRAGYVQSLHGKYGGYRLASNPENYTIGDIIRVLDKPIVPVDCLATQYNTCEKCDTCHMLDYWEGLTELVNDYFDNVTLQDVLNWKKEKAEG